ncbi:MAG: hypothetical protein KIS87_11665 [Phycisphaeraceae bacterium]|nr:hypothetical protein [Phycisphaeraceae bacterium]
MDSEHVKDRVGVRRPVAYILTALLFVAAGVYLVANMAKRKPNTDFGAWIFEASRIAIGKMHDYPSVSVEEALAESLARMRSRGFGYLDYYETFSVYYNRSREAWLCEQGNGSPAVLLLSGEPSTLARNRGKYAAIVSDSFLVIFLDEEEAISIRDDLSLLTSHK